MISPPAATIRARAVAVDTVKGAGGLGASIPEAAEHFIFCYPFHFEKGLFPRDAAEDEDPDVAFLTVGGFVYFDGSLRALRLNALM